MDLATIAGIVSGFGLVIIAMSMGGGLLWFIDIPSALIVLGGTTGAVLINYPISDMLGVMKVAKQVFFQKDLNTGWAIETLVTMSKTARREGILALEKKLDEIKDPFFLKGINLMIDGIEPGTLSKIMHTELESIEDRHRLGAEIFTTMGNFAPAMGMMGTLIGLVKMLMQMEDPSSIGPAMSVALITTFYGVILSNLIFLPIAGKLKTRSAREILVKELVINGILSVQSGDNPRVLEQKLHSFISPGERKTIV
ncbi:MAG: MotA/TolQ/ExbB proton channel family protein [Syntrophales bacterium]|jgi:chemotaxis protein MotA|nr:MotA/TolQ/ExbB proton channel family protein [Syntrophales bacterium]MDY0043107.1 MotA/TolQ/ExbB proton channel family protein [Syntrophales bacterium]